MDHVRRRMPTALTLTLGIILGWTLATHKAPNARASGGDRYGDYSMATGPISVEYNNLTKTQSQKDAIYFLDYKAGKLLATVPVQRETMAGSQLLDNFIERDLVADFKIDADSRTTPHFLMTTGSLGAYADGSSPLFVFETTTKQVAAYKIQLQAIGTKASSRFVLMELKSFASLPTLPDGVN
ncbi:hypothetical protein P12x_000761 [Tundrisphaera lichenicola]|uniref:hypothetical protein n=1 Tax=Tundrisphaera lichenicola TaxID=2029860 RepID=UPI003EBF7D46